MTNANDPQSNLPRPIVKKMRWPFPIIWIVPLAAAALAGYFLYQHHQQSGEEITIRFADAAGIKPGDTMIAVHGVPVGRVTGIELDSDHLHVLVHVRLDQSAQAVASQGTLFWLVRPEISLENITLSGLSTIVSGPYIEARPGSGPPAATFDGMMEPPKTLSPGIDILLRTDHLEQLVSDSPITYRGIQVGVVEEVRLANDAQSAEVIARIWRRYEPLVRVNSQFYMLKGADIQGGLLGGLKLQVNSLRALLTGGIAFASPDQYMGNQATQGAEFFLSDQPKDEWLKWKPRIPLAAEENEADSENGPSKPTLLPTLKHE